MNTQSSDNHAISAERRIGKMVLNKKNETITQKEIFRLAATLFVNVSNSYSTADTQLQMIKLAFFEKANSLMDCNEIAAEVLELFKYHISEDEIIAAISRNKDVLQETKDSGRKTYCLAPESYDELAAADKRTIDYYIDQYAKEKVKDCSLCMDAIHRYLYELTTTNINTYQVLLAGKQGADYSDSDLTVDTDSFSDDEILLIKDFLDWDNEEKNESVGNIVFCCLEYCLLVNGDSPNGLLKDVIRQREIYLDTNIIFRALGIDGPARKKVVLAFLDKCKQANLIILVSSQTKTEFDEAINHYISQIKQYPRGSVFLGAYEQLSGYTIFSYFEEWRATHKELSPDSFKLYINSAYLSLVSKYEIIDNERIPDDIYISDDFKEYRNSYTKSIKAAKQSARLFYYDSYDGYSKTDSHDASVIRYIEIKRALDKNKKEIFLVSSDKALRYWDMSRDGNDYPIVIYPSQLYLMLIKLCGRAENDYESFVSFINIRPKSQQISPEKANAIISGISTITEDITTQKLLVSAVYNEEFQDIIHHSNTDLELYENAKEYSARYLDEELKKREQEIEQKSGQIDRLSDDLSIQEDKLSNAEGTIQAKEEELKKKNEQLRKLAEKHINPIYVWKRTVVPCILGLASLLFVVFILLQFIYTNESWNFAVKFYNWASGTYFGQKVGDYVYLIDAVFAGVLWFFLKKFYKNPFNKSSKKQYKDELIDSYIKKIESE